MSNYTDVIKLGVDAYHGATKVYSVSDSMDVLRQALIDANGGSTKLNYKNIRDGKCVGLFSIVEEVLKRTIVQGLQGDEYFNSLVDFKNVSLGDENRFLVEDDILYTVSEAANGTQGIRRQRLGGVSEIAIPTTFKTVKIYEELSRVLTGQVDFNKFIESVSKSFRRKLLDDIYTLWNGATAQDFGNSFYPAAGSYDEDTMLDIIANVEAAANASATIIGTKKALRKLEPSIKGEKAKEDLYTMGYYGTFYGTPVVATPQRHKINSSDFVFDDDVITVLAGDGKPIKCVYEGQSTIVTGDPLSKADFTQEYLYGEMYGLGIVVAGGESGIGRYKTV